MGAILLSSSVWFDAPTTNMVAKSAFLTALQLLALSLGGLATARTTSPGSLWPIKRATTSLDAWLATELSYALDGALNNIGADGAKAQGASSGMVVASPSKSNPNCM